MDSERQRVDAALVERGLATSRGRAQALIASGLATVNGMVITKASQKVGPEDALQVLGEVVPYVSRGGLKLAKALDAFGVSVTGLVCADVGASTGGFTDVLLQRGARRVYAIDVGTDQLHEKLRRDGRVTSMEHVNARALNRSMFPEPPSLAVMDVSFISIRLILPALFETLGAEGRVISLVKPQFEAGRQDVGKRGVVAKPEVHRRVLSEIVDFAPTLGWRVRALEYSPIAGGDGNLEFLADFVPGATGGWIGKPEIEAVVARARQGV